MKSFILLPVKLIRLGRGGDNGGDGDAGVAGDVASVYLLVLVWFLPFLAAPICRMSEEPPVSRSWPTSGSFKMPVALVTAWLCSHNTVSPCVVGHPAVDRGHSDGEHSNNHCN